MSRENPDDGLTWEGETRGSPEAYAACRENGGHARGQSALHGWCDPEIDQERKLVLLYEACTNCGHRELYAVAELGPDGHEVPGTRIPAIGGATP